MKFHHDKVFLCFLKREWVPVFPPALTILCPRIMPFPFVRSGSEDVCAVFTLRLSFC